MLFGDGETGRLVKAADSVALADGIIEMLTQTERAHRMAAKGQIEVGEHFSIDAMITENIKVYHEILSEKS